MVAFAYGAALELVQDGASGVLVPGVRDSDFVDAARRLAVSTQTLEQIRAAAPASVAHVAWDRVYDNFIAVLQQALAVNGHSFTASAQAISALSRPHA